MDCARCGKSAQLLASDGRVFPTWTEPGWREIRDRAAVPPLRREVVKNSRWAKAAIGLGYAISLSALSWALVSILLAP